MSDIKRIVLYLPDADLLKKVKILNPQSYQIIGCVESKPENGNSDYVKLADEDVDKLSYDYVLISFPMFRITKEHLNNDMGIDMAKIYTYEEFRVKDCEERINEKYHTRWDAISRDSDRQLLGKTVLISGGGSGIGRECARIFASYGANVIITGRNTDKLKDTCKYAGMYGNVSYLQWDIKDVSSFETNLQDALRIFDGSIDILVNSAGIIDDSSMPFSCVNTGKFDEVISVNLRGTYFMCQTFANYFINKHINGHIVNVASVLGLLPTVKPYGISKWGVVGLTKGLGMALAEYGITVNGVAPGEVATPILKWQEGNCPARRASKTGRVSFPCEIAQSILFLADYTGENYIGEVVNCSGGDTTTSVKI